LPFLITVIAIIGFFILVLSIRMSVLVEYSEYITLTVKWLFFKFNLLPLTTQQMKKKAQKEEKAKEKKARREGEIKAEASEEQPSPGKTVTAAKKSGPKPSLFKELWEAYGYDGLVKMLKDSVNALNRFSRNLLRSVIIDRLYFTMRVSKSDAAATAIEYGRVCTELYPLFGAIVSHLRTKEYDIDIFPDYLAGKSAVFLHVNLLVCPRRVINAAIGLGFRLLFKVVLKVLIKLLRKPKKQSKINEVENSDKVGALA
jgi:hypothetical protein